MLVTTDCHIVGPGALGGLFAFRLQALGFHVSLVGRSPVAHQQALTLLTSNGAHTTSFPIQGPEAQDSISLLWVTTKSYAALEAVTRLSHRMAWAITVLYRRFFREDSLPDQRLQGALPQTLTLESWRARAKLGWAGGVELTHLRIGLKH